MNSLARRSIAAALAITALLIAVVAFDPSRAAGATELALGASVVVDLQGNPSTGYSWRLDAQKSENAGIVAIDDLGYVFSQPASGEERRVGSPASYHIRVTGTAAGTAKLVFEYVQPWVGKPARTQTRTVHVTAAE